MASTTYFHTVTRSYVDVDTSKGVDTAQFLDATEGVVKLFDSLGSSAFTVVQNDMNGNIKKIRTRYLSNPTANDTLENLLANEAHEKKRVATEGLLWLIRGLDFTAQALRRSLSDQTEELTISFTKSYEATLKKFHGILVRPVFSLAMKACPYRKDFYEKINVQSSDDIAVMKAWLAALEAIIATAQAVFVAHPEYIKGM
ncbi:glycolipid transfer protein domain-containing protein [Halteromyces radiatus]|uniref:glycolipid transfer protein domain-containing protein n=1 Tax=Halteromyces radiatus TaxID=101107 RepID=UPI0022209175|nr:glycolipid transfer protein domain-containing protein [Halteromyces radiatus]KAI8097114.1 glycolipid transfer protein domain-containing protein [Halteromyces radiatus]